MYGWMGKILRVNLSSGKISTEELEPKLARDFIGGLGLGAKYLYDEIDPNIDPLSPDNKLILATGPATGTGAQGATRYEAVTKSPLTGAVAAASSSGFWPSQFKFTGHDVLIIEGKAREPVYLWIQDGKAELRPAAKIWGSTVSQTQEAVRAETDPKARVLSIGPAGERLVRFACIMNDEGCAAGRSGVGAIMGSKNLKAVGVKGSKKIVVADEAKLKKAAEDGRALLPKPWLFSQYGTPFAVTFANNIGVFPTRNWQANVFEGADKLGSEEVQKVTVKHSSCYRCWVGCGLITKTTDPKFAGEGHGPEYEGIGSLGSGCGVDNVAAVIKAYQLCNELGMDVISCGYTISCAMELSERGFLPEKDAGIRLRFGDAEAMVRLVEQTAYREGFGDLIAEGSYRLAKKYGHPELSMSVKKQECPAWDPRGLQGLGLGYAVSPTGASHMRSEMENAEGLGIEIQLMARLGYGGKVDRFATNGKAAYTMVMENNKATVDSMGICSPLSPYRIGLNAIYELEAITGVDYGVEGWMKTGERIWNVMRLFNLKAGLTAKDDTLPKRLLEEPTLEGPSKGHVVKLAEMLPEYYRLRGWDSEGRPTPEKLKELGLA
ncbi:MAG: aldehyde ferredoxin oxidoreductase family protein [Chloroflexi bacterium]|nr:aldehyde ferredoxin oxidoreductase family protein [Chloroflexota bacterium]